MARVSVLQLDTRFPRVPGDVACPATYRAALEVIRVPRATVGGVVTARPEEVDLAPFEAALARAGGDLIVTSCGFLAPFQDRLAAAAPAPFIASALGLLPGLSARLGAGALRVLTFDAGKLGPAHLPPGTGAVGIGGLAPGSHLRQVIERDRTALDPARAEAEVCASADRLLGPGTRALLLECTNLPPYKAAIRRRHRVEIHDILTAIEARLPGAVAPAWL